MEFKKAFLKDRKFSNRSEAEVSNKWSIIRYINDTNDLPDTIHNILKLFADDHFWSGPLESSCWFSFAPAFQLFRAVESSSLFHLCN